MTQTTRKESDADFRRFDASSRSKISHTSTLSESSDDIAMMTNEPWTAQQQSSASTLQLLRPDPLLMFITDIRPDDILLGRGAPMIKNQGNVRFREMIARRKVKYMSSGRHHRKALIAQEILSEVANRQGRFLRKVQSIDEAKRLGVPEGQIAWVLANSDIVLEKVKQALRDRDPVEAAGGADYSYSSPKNEISSILPSVITGFDEQNVTSVITGFDEQNVTSDATLQLAIARLASADSSGALAFLQAKSAITLQEQQNRIFNQVHHHIDMPNLALLQKLQHRQLLRQQEMRLFQGLRNQRTLLNLQVHSALFPNNSISRSLPFLGQTASGVGLGAARWSTTGTSGTPMNAIVAPVTGIHNPSLPMRYCSFSIPAGMSCIDAANSSNETVTGKIVSVVFPTPDIEVGTKRVASTENDGKKNPAKKSRTF